MEYREHGLGHAMFEVAAGNPFTDTVLELKGKVQARVITLRFGGACRRYVKPQDRKTTPRKCGVCR